MNLSFQIREPPFGRVHLIGGRSQSPGVAAQTSESRLFVSRGRVRVRGKSRSVQLDFLSFLCRCFSSCVSFGSANLKLSQSEPLQLQQ